MAQINIAAALDIVTTAHADGNVVEYIFADTIHKATITVEGQTGSVATSGTHTDPQISNRQPLAADIPFELRLKQGQGRAGAVSLFVAAAAAGDVTVIAEVG